MKTCYDNGVNCAERANGSCVHSPRRYIIQFRRNGHNWRQDDVLEIFIDLNELARRRASVDYKGVDTRVCELLANGEVR